MHNATGSAPAGAARKAHLPAPSATASSRPAPPPAPPAAPGGGGLPGFGGPPEMNGGAQSAQVWVKRFRVLSLQDLEQPSQVCGVACFTPLNILKRQVPGARQVRACVESPENLEASGWCPSAADAKLRQRAILSRSTPWYLLEPLPLQNSMGSASNFKRV